MNMCVIVMIPIDKAMPVSNPIWELGRTEPRDDGWTFFVDDWVFVDCYKLLCSNIFNDIIQFDGISSYVCHCADGGLE
jgi:hypothetical protein